MNYSIPLVTVVAFVALVAVVAILAQGSPTSDSFTQQELVAIYDSDGNQVGYSLVVDFATRGDDAVLDDMYMHNPPGSNANVVGKGSQSIPTEVRNIPPQASNAVTVPETDDYYPYWNTRSADSYDKKEDISKDSVWNFH